jgi:hypothetical protein
VPVLLLLHQHTIPDMWSLRTEQWLLPRTITELGIIINASGCPFNDVMANVMMQQLIPELF